MKGPADAGTVAPGDQKTPAQRGNSGMNPASPGTLSPASITGADGRANEQSGASPCPLSHIPLASHGTQTRHGTPASFTTPPCPGAPENPQTACLSRSQPLSARALLSILVLDQARQRSLRPCC